MAKYDYNGDSELVFPSLGLVVNKGDSFEGPDGITADGVTVSGKAPKVSAPAPVADDLTATTEDVK